MYMYRYMQYMHKYIHECTCTCISVVVCCVNENGFSQVVQGPYIGADNRVKHTRLIGEEIPQQPIEGACYCVLVTHVNVHVHVHCACTHDCTVM